MAVEVVQGGGAEKEFPETLGRYRLVRRISTGGMATVYEARRESLAGVAPRVAIKVILPEYARDTNFQKLFVNEARMGSQLQHPNLVQIQDFDREKDCYYLVMEYVEGPTLRRILSLSKRNSLEIPLPVIAELGRQICEGLHYAHTAVDEEDNPRHLVHRDIKPGNVILNPQGVVKVLDFGISKALSVQPAADGVKGTWGYMSPEQSRAEAVSGAADQWGVAAVLFELACLQRLFAERDQKIIRERMEKDDGARQATGLSGPYRDLGPILVRALQRDPMARYPSALDFGRALAELVPDPIVTREALIEFQKKISTLDATRLQGGDLARSQSTMSKVPSGKPYQAGIPVSVGNVHRAMSPAEIRPEQRPAQKQKPSRSASTLYLAFVGLAVCVLIFTVVQIFSGGGSDTIDEQALTDGMSSPVLEVPEKAPVKTPSESRPAPLPKKEAPTKPSPVESKKKPVVQPKPTPTAPAAVKKKPEPTRPKTTTKSPATAPKVAPVTEKPAAVITGLLRISSSPRSKLYIDGKYIQDTPLNNYAVPVGSRKIRLVPPDGAPKSFDVFVEEDRLTVKIWNFETQSWFAE